MNKQLVARWQSRGGKYWLELYRDDGGYSYRSDNSGGFMGNISQERALARVGELISYWPSKARKETHN